jgi:RNA polymerase sigma factor (sigma-70 family)
MQNESDAQLLREYAVQRSEPAFAELVARHTDLVYSAAWRQTGRPDLAREITQRVFTDLARKARELAGSLPANASLVGWLYRGTRYAGLALLRAERRRQTHERQVMEHFNPVPENDPDWERVGPVLDAAMAELDEADRDAVLLRFFKNQNFRAVGLALGVSDDAAQKRVSRAVDRLREFLAKRGVIAGASGLVVAISTHAVQAAPGGLSAAIAATAASSTLVNATWPFLAWIKAKLAILIPAVVLLGGAATYVLTRPPPESENLAEEVRGIGLALGRNRETGEPTVMIVVPGSLAARAGLSKGLVLHAIGGVPTAGMGLRECVRRIQGPSGSTVQLDLIDPQRGVTNILTYTRASAAESLGGIGVALGREKDAPATIMAVTPGSTAAQAGLSKGVIILAIDGVPTAGMNPRDCLNRIQGRAGSVVRLEVINPKRDLTNTIELTRYRL